MLRADSPLRNAKDEESDSKSSIDEFLGLKDAKDYKGIQNDGHKAKENQANKVEAMGTGHT